MRYDPSTTTEIILIWKINYNQINIGIFIFECCICITQGELPIKKTGNIFWTKIDIPESNVEIEALQSYGQNRLLEYREEFIKKYESNNKKND